MLEVADAAGLAGWIEFVRQCIGTQVEVMIVAGFVNADAPQNDAGMIPIATNHAADVVDTEQLPGLVANVLPARDFFEHEQSQFVASVEEVPGLRIVRCTHDIAVQVPPQNFSVAPLHAPRHCLTDKRKSLMTIEAAELDDLAIELEAVIGKLRVAKADFAGIGIDQFRAALQAHMNRVKIGIAEIP